MAGYVAKNVTKQFKGYLEEYAAYVTDRGTSPGHFNWEGSVMFVLADSFLQQDIYVIRQPLEDHLHGTALRLPAKLDVKGYPGD